MTRNLPCPSCGYHFGHTTWCANNPKNGAPVPAADVPQDEARGPGLAIPSGPGRWYTDEEVADLLRGARAEALRDFCQWIAFNRVYNGADDPGQSLYNEGLNGHLPKWAEDYLVARADHPAPDHRARAGLREGG